MATEKENVIPEEHGAWTLLRDRQDADELCRRLRSFHDMLLRELKYQSGPFADSSGSVSFGGLSHARCCLQAGPPALPAVELVFLDVSTLHVESQNHDPIDEGDLTWGASRVTWSADNTRITARALMWRAVPHWTGPRDRYTAVGDGADESYYNFEA